MARRTERHQAVEIEVRAPLGALDDVVDLEGTPAATGLAPPTGAVEHYPADRRPLLQGGRGAPDGARAATLDPATRRLFVAICRACTGLLATLRPWPIWSWPGGHFGAMISQVCGHCFGMQSSKRR
jgi:hypothetical protein